MEIVIKIDDHYHLVDGRTVKKGIDLVYDGCIQHSKLKTYLIENGWFYQKLNENTVRAFPGPLDIDEILSLNGVSPETVRKHIEKIREQHRFLRKD